MERYSIAMEYGERESGTGIVFLEYSIAMVSGVHVSGETIWLDAVGIGLKILSLCYESKRKQYLFTVESCFLF